MSDIRKHVSLCLLQILGLVLVMAGSVLAQLPTGTILGTIKDSTGAVIAGASVTVTNSDTGFTRSTMSEADGSYRLPALPVGNYKLRATHEGFQSEERSGLTLEVTQEAVIDVTLQVGSTSQTVTVTEAVPLVDTTSSSVGGTVNEERVADLPLNGRNWTDLTLLQTGVIKINMFAGTSGSVDMNGTFYSSNGAAVRSNMYLLDGADTRTGNGLNNTSITNTSLGVDGIKEYKVVSVLADASYGLGMGSQTTIVSKGGTNQFHGDAFEYLRNASLDARNYFDALDTANVNGDGTDKSVVFPGKRIPPFRKNNFGGAFGGPIQKDKTFVYGVYEGIREQIGVTTTKTTIPKACFVDQNSALQSVVPAKITNKNAYGTCASFTSPFPSWYNNTTGIITVSPSVLPLADMYPQPNVFGYTTFNYSIPFIQPVQEDYWQIRADHNFSAADSAFFRYTQDIADQTPLYTFTGFNVQQHSASQFATLSETHVFSNSLLNTFRFSISRTGAYIYNAPQPASVLTDSTLLVSAADQTADQARTIHFGNQSPGSSVSALGGQQNDQKVYQDLFTWSDDVYWTKGKHAFKFGGLLNYYQYFVNTQYELAGILAFGSLANYFGGDYSSWMVGPPAGANGLRDFHFNSYGFYAQDDYRATSRLTLNLGLRYELLTVPRSTNPANAWELRNPAVDASPTAGPLYQNDGLHNFMPRVGFAWDVFGKGKTSIRGGAGLYYDIGGLGNNLMNNAINGPPVSFSVTLTNTAVTPTTPFAVPFPHISSPPSARSIQNNLRMPGLLQRSLTLDQQLPWNMGLTVSYIGSQAWHLWQVREGDNTIPAGVNAQGVPFYYCYNSTLTGRVLPGPNGACQSGFSTSGPRVNPAWNLEQLDQTEGNSYYNSLQVSLNKRVTQGLQFQFNYTYSKLEDDGTSVAFSEGATEVTQVPNGYNNLSDRGPATYDATHNVRVNMIYHLPGLGSSGFVSKFSNGWWISTIVAAQSGYAFTPVLGQDRALQNDSGESERPNLDPSFNRNTVIEGTVAQWFNPTMFDVPAAGTLGTAGRGILRGPGLTNVDFSLVKDTKVAFLGEAGSLQFRAEFFNLLNHANFAQPNATVYSPGGAVSVNPAGQIGSTVGGTLLPVFGSAGNITSTVTNSRQIQFALKVLF